MESRFTPDQEYVVKRLVIEQEKLAVYKSKTYPEGSANALLQSAMVWFAEVRVNELAKILQELNRKQYA